MVDKAIPPVRTEAIFDASGSFTIRYHEFFEGLPEDIRDTEDRLDTIDDFIPTISIQSSNYTTTRTEIVVCTATITVTLNLSPKDLERVGVKSAVNDINPVIDGNGKDIDFDSTVTLSRNLQEQDFLFSSELDKWLKV